MKHLITLIFLIVFYGSMPGQNVSMTPVTPGNGGRWVLVIHGGAGGPGPGVMAPEKEKQFTDSLDKALAIGSQILASGGSSLDAVEAVIRFMEDCPLFNAGKGAVYNAEGIAELDASIMDGETGLAGAVTGVHIIKNPITAARRVMTATPHVLLMGEGAEEFAKSQGLDIVDPSYFKTKERTAQYEKMKKEKNEHGTVGCAALDNKGNLAAGTSTGGRMMKMKGRIGDTPIIGAGTYASNATCAVSCTGYGEYFIRNSVAFDVSAMMELKGSSLEEAATFIIMEKLKNMGGDGGLIAVDKEGNFVTVFNTDAMFRGFATYDGRHGTGIYK
jgi:L-asparaginase / beta-aspartyl-peptidase